jgi:hypothetical protein
MNHDEIIEAAHKTIRDWKKLVTAAAIENGGQLRVPDRSINQAPGHVLHIYHNQTHRQTIIDAEPESPQKDAMKKTKAQLWTDWFDKQKPEDQRTIALAAVERLVDMDEVSFRQADPEEPELTECLYWSSCGEDLRIPF